MINISNFILPPTQLNVKSLIPCLIPKTYCVKKLQFLERAKGFEPSTSTLARSRLTPGSNPIFDFRSINPRFLG